MNSKNSCDTNSFRNGDEYKYLPLGTEEDIIELRRAIHCKYNASESSIFIQSISFSDLMLFLNIRTDITNFYPDASSKFIMRTKEYLRTKKNELECKFTEYSTSISKWINFILTRRDIKKILMKDGMNFLNFMRFRVHNDIYNYLVELYTTEKNLILVKNYELKHIIYDNLDFECKVIKNSQLTSS